MFNTRILSSVNCTCTVVQYFMIFFSVKRDRMPLLEHMDTWPQRFYLKAGTAIMELTFCYLQLTFCYLQLTFCYFQLTFCYLQLTIRHLQLTFYQFKPTCHYLKLTFLKLFSTLLLYSKNISLF